MDNYQLGPREVSVRVTTKMVKEMTLFLDKGDDYKVDWWKDQVQDSNISTVLIECEKIVKKLRGLGHYYFAGVNLYNLEHDCHDWTEGDLDVEEIR